MGEEKKNKEGEGNTNASEDGGEKKESEEERMVLKVDMHCDACAKKVVKVLKGLQGVEDVAVDRKANNVVVKAGKSAEATELCETIQKKTGRKAQIAFPLQLPNPPHPHHQHLPQKDQVPKPKDQPPEPKVITVVLRVQMHCQACAHILRRRIRKFKGVESVETDVANDQVIVKGRIGDPATLVKYVNKKTKKQVSLLVKDNKDVDNEAAAAEAKENEQISNKKSLSGHVEGKQEDIDKMRSHVIRPYEYASYGPLYYWPTSHNYDAFNYHHQASSDENPNGCTTM